MSNKVTVNEARFQELGGKVVVLTGGANGIGASTVRALVNAGAKVAFGDFDIPAGEQLVESLSNAPIPPLFVKMDASKYDDNIKLFRTALEKFGHVDHAIACAGILERGKWFDPELTIETVEKPETEKVIAVNLLGTLYFARIAAVYLRHGREEGQDRSLTLISSAAGFRDSPGLFLYQASKHGVMGLLRALRKILYECVAPSQLWKYMYPELILLARRDHIRVNAICPAITDSAMTTSIIDGFRQSNQAINTCDDVAKYIVGLEVATEMNGKAVYVEGGRGWEFTDGLDASMPLWLGEEPTNRIREHLRHIGQASASKDFGCYRC
ncbi:hypothetical protein LTR08_000776 [Meristemomyces frigidus]|nr:hypothetical protein LTR08_000776 [Meristemomyces frigidus]